MGEENETGDVPGGGGGRGGTWSKVQYSPGNLLTLSLGSQWNISNLPGTSLIQAPRQSLRAKDKKC